MTSNYVLSFLALVVLLLLFGGQCIPHNRKRKPHRYTYPGNRSTANPYTKTICMQLDNTIRARHKTCFLRPDTGPCRADIIQWYFDAKEDECYRFFWGGCQGNGNRYETSKECLGNCQLDGAATPPPRIPFFCSMGFDYGTCFGQYNRWGWDKFGKTCKRRLYSGCGGNQNNFESQNECMKTCLTPPDNTLNRSSLMTTCVPFLIPGLQ